ncbi:hypothetical protein Phum_PHUM596520 [Pediculus humanus corporis]|uniref:Uncharacterized protein n=1 Tax=Pediculus humanus subsp. corporis TaxID=121224 RepID=E0W2R0_PEDHC|nr:uncharacterized protein Phum_PHUM596520 [Pediculus humanus corporis]EEB19916.1 hypothetical protein Phum_PHUM596520 [Pediculus humanus corporis]
MKQEDKIKMVKKLKDYPSIPSTPPPSDKKDKQIKNLEDELEHERKYLYTLCIENKELEEILTNFDKEINQIKNSFPQNVGKFITLLKSTPGKRIF